jgi:hypothetical protein
MSYSRFGRYSDWYVYRKSGARKLEDETLIVWHVTAAPRRPATEFRHAEVAEMLERNDFSRISGWSPSAPPSPVSSKPPRQPAGVYFSREYGPAGRSSEAEPS